MSMNTEKKKKKKKKKKVVVQLLKQKFASRNLPYFLKIYCSSSRSNWIKIFALAPM
jgi:hypothetical protein